MSESKAVFHDPVSPSERYEQEVKEGADHPISYGAESRGGTWKAERDPGSKVSEQMEKGKEEGEKNAATRSKKDDDYKRPS